MRWRWLLQGWLVGLLALMARTFESELAPPPIRTKWPPTLRRWETMLKSLSKLSIEGSLNGEFNQNGCNNIQCGHWLISTTTKKWKIITNLQTVFWNRRIWIQQNFTDYLDVLVSRDTPKVVWSEASREQGTTIEQNCFWHTRIHIKQIRKIEDARCIIRPYRAVATQLEPARYMHTSYLLVSVAVHRFNFIPYYYFFFLNS